MEAGAFCPARHVVGLEVSHGLQPTGATEGCETGYKFIHQPAHQGLVVGQTEVPGLRPSRGLERVPEDQCACARPMR